VQVAADLGDRLLGLLSVLACWRVKQYYAFVEGGCVSEPNWDEVVGQLGFDPGVWEVDRRFPVQVRSWDAADGQRLFYYKASVVPKLEFKEDVGELVREVRRRKLGRVPVAESGRWLVVCLADWQAGKSDHGGVEALLERLYRLRDLVPERVRELRRAGRPVEGLLVMGLGDMVEACDGHYAMQTFQVELDQRQQERLVRRVLVDLLGVWVKLAPKMIVGAVPGNHGEARKGGKAFTSFDDNNDLKVFETVQEILSRNPETFGHVGWVIPDGDMAAVVELSGQKLAFAHGHQARAGSGPAGKLKNWWQAKMYTDHPVGEAKILVSGHYHHLQVVQDGVRTWFQCPANDGGSRWFEEQGGATTRCGTLTFTVDVDGWDDLKVLS
jgi:predicted phosphodiesterase